MGDEITLLVRQEIATPVRPRVGGTSGATTDSTASSFVLGGRSGQVIDLKFTYSANFSRDQHQEKERIVDEVRVKQMKKNPETGKQEVNEENYIDVQVPKQINMVGPRGVESIDKFNPESISTINVKDGEISNVEVLNKDVKIKNPDYTPPADVDDDDTPLLAFGADIGTLSAARVPSVKPEPRRKRIDRRPVLRR